MACKLQATEDCHKTSGGSFLCVPKRGTNPSTGLIQRRVVEHAPHTGNLYEMREAAKKVPVTPATKYRVTAAEVGPGWRELHSGEKCAVGGGEPPKPGERGIGVAYGKVTISTQSFGLLTPMLETIHIIIHTSRRVSYCSKLVVCCTLVTRPNGRVITGTSRSSRLSRHLQSKYCGRGILAPLGINTLLRMRDKFDLHSPPNMGI